MRKSCSKGQGPGLRSIILRSQLGTVVMWPAKMRHGAPWMNEGDETERRNPLGLRAVRLQEPRPSSARGQNEAPHVRQHAKGRVVNLEGLTTSIVPASAARGRLRLRAAENHRTWASSRSHTTARSVERVPNVNVRPSFPYGHSCRAAARPRRSHITRSEVDMHEWHKLALAQCVQGGRVHRQASRHRVAAVQGGSNPEQADWACEVRPYRLARRVDDEPSERRGTDVLRVACVFTLIAALVLLATFCARYAAYMDAYALAM